MMTTPPQVGRNVGGHGGSVNCPLVNEPVAVERCLTCPWGIAASQYGSTVEVNCTADTVTRATH